MNPRFQVFDIRRSFKLVKELLNCVATLIISRLKKENKDLKLTRITAHGKRQEHLWSIISMFLGPILLNILPNISCATYSKRQQKTNKQMECIRCNNYILKFFQLEVFSMFILILTLQFGCSKSW